MGGGEKYSGAIAQFLAAEHQVELLSHDEVDLAEVGGRLGLDLSRVGLKIISDDVGFSAAIEASASYDLFVNASHLDYFAPKARRNVLVVYFPATSIEQAQALGGYNRAKRLLRQRVGRLLGPAARGRLRTLIFVDAATSSDQTIAGRLAVGAFRLVSARKQQSAILDAYAQIVTISAFSQRWIERYWERLSVVLYPPVDVDAFALVDKRRWILGVGRFFAGSHNKKHIALIDAFKSVRGGPLSDWELHLAGGYTATATNAAYLDDVRRAAEADPRIRLHVNCSIADLRDLYCRSTLFWHGTGLGEREADHPERFEHFGLTTVEAMAAGCVPLALDAGGQPEIIHSGVDGVLWSTASELIAASIELVSDHSRRERLAAAARKRARDFGLPEFRSRLTEIIK